jgi:predicted DNA-binding transcriptional regulator AlpA
MTPLALSTIAPSPRQRDTSFYGTGPDDRLIRISEVEHLVGYGATSIYAKIKLGIFPAPVKPCARDSSRWVLGEIRKFNADAIAARDHERATIAPNSDNNLTAPSVDGRTHQRRPR